MKRDVVQRITPEAISGSFQARSEVVADVAKDYDAAWCEWLRWDADITSDIRWKLLVWRVAFCCDGIRCVVNSRDSWRCSETWRDVGAWTDTTRGNSREAFVAASAVASCRGAARDVETGKSLALGREAFGARRLEGLSSLVDGNVKRCLDSAWRAAKR